MLQQNNLPILINTELKHRKQKWKTFLAKTDPDKLGKEEDMPLRGVLKAGFMKDTSRTHLQNKEVITTQLLYEMIR